MAAEKDDVENLVFLIQNGANLNIMDKFGKIALHYAAEKGYESIVEMLIESGAVVDVTDYANQKPIQYAIYGSNYLTSLFILHRLYKCTINNNETMKMFTPALSIFLQITKKLPICYEKQNTHNIYKKVHLIRFGSVNILITSCNKSST